MVLPYKIREKASLKETRDSVSYDELVTSVRLLREAEDECTAEGGVWRTIKGTHVCIKKGETTANAFKRTTGKNLDADTPSGDKTGKDLKGGKTNSKTGKDMPKTQNIIQKTQANKSPDYANLKPEYKTLADKLDPVNIPETDGNDKLAAQAMKYAKGTKYFDPNDPENEGLNLGQRATQREWEKEAQKHCSHPNLKNELYTTHTADARRKIQQTCSCNFCKLFRRRTAEERVKEW